jgi:hypothetical protein
MMYFERHGLFCACSHYKDLPEHSSLHAQKSGICGDWRGYVAIPKPHPLWRIHYFDLVRDMPGRTQEVLTKFFFSQINISQTSLGLASVQLNRIVLFGHAFGIDFSDIGDVIFRDPNFWVFGFGSGINSNEQSIQNETEALARTLHALKMPSISVEHDFPAFTKCDII